MRKVIQRSLAALFCLAAVLFLIPVAQAEEMHRHGHVTTSVSPFEGKKDVLSEHCALNKLSHLHSQAAFCPHTPLPAKATAELPSLAKDCGGVPHNPEQIHFNSDFSYYDLNLQAWDFNPGLSGDADSASSGSIFSLPQFLDHPPRFS
jgi:hypothetical protein